MVCLDEDGAGRAPGAAVERHPLGRRGHRPHRRARRRRRERGRGLGRRRRPRAGGVVHGHQAALAGRARAGATPPASAAVCLPHDWLTWRLAGTGRLEDLVTDRGDASGTGYWSPRPRSTGPTCSSWASAGRCVAAAGARPGRARPGTVAGGAGARARAPATTPPRRSGVGAQAGDVVALDRHVRRRVDRVDDGRRRPERHRRRVRRRHRPLPAAGRDAQRRPGARRDGAPARRRPRRRCPGWRCRRPRAPAGWCSCPTWRASAPPTSPWSTGAVHGLTLGTSRPGPPRPGRRRGAAVRARRRPGRDPRAAAARRAGSCSSAARARSEAVRRLAPAVLGVPVLVPPPGEYVADGAARQAAWVLAGGDAPPEWPASETEIVRGRSRSRGARALRRGPRPHRPAAGRQELTACSVVGYGLPAPIMRSWCPCLSVGRGQHLHDRAGGPGVGAGSGDHARSGSPRHRHVQAVPCRAWTLRPHVRPVDQRGASPTATRGCRACSGVRATRTSSPPTTAAP